MMNTVSNDMLIVDVLNSLTDKVSMDKINDVKAVLYMHLGTKKIYEDVSSSQLPAGYTDDTPRVIELWLQCLRLERRTENTINNYRLEIRNFFSRVGKNYADVTTNDVRMYLAWRQSVHKNSDTTINNKIHVLYSFYNWIMDEDLIEDGGFLARKPKKNPMSKIKIVKVAKKVKRVLSDEEMELIRCSCKSERDLAIVDMLEGSGMRIGELVALNRSDIDFKRGRCIIYGKGRKERIAYLTGKATVHLENYIGSRTDDEEPLFINSRKSRVQHDKQENAVYGRMSADSIRNMLNRSCKAESRLNNAHVHPHAFRAYMATTMNRRGARAEDIQLLLGHSSVDTTIRYYVARDDKSAADAYGRYAS